MTKCAFFHPALCIEHRSEANCGGDCERCPYGNSFPDATTPTVAEILSHYAEISTRIGVPRAVTVSLNVSRVRSLCAVLGIPLDAKHTEIASRIDEFPSLAHDSMSEATIEGVIQSVRAVFSDRMHEEYSRIGLTVMKFKVPKYRAKKGGYTRLTDEQTRHLKGVLIDAYTAAPRNFTIMALAWCQGMRIEDICALRWDAFTTDNGVTWLSYTPIKTSDSSGRQVRWPVSHELWRMMCNVRFDDSEFVLGDPAKYGSHRPDLRRRFNTWLRDKVTFFRTTAKAAHELRKAGGDAIYRAYGLQRAADFLGDDPKTVAKHYADVHRLDFVPKSVLEI